MPHQRSKTPVFRPRGLTVGSTEEWHTWVSHLARFSGRSKADLINDALKVFADNLGFRPPQPSR